MSDYVCEELMAEILARLPPKSLLRFRSVSKSLRAYIDSPGFIHMHTCRSSQSVVLTHAVQHSSIEEYGGDSVFFTLHVEDQLPLCGYIGITPFLFPRSNVKIAGTSCNGIICLFEPGKDIISLWNPSIKRQLNLPDCPHRGINGMGIGLGFDPITDDIKIVSIPQYGNVNRGIVESSFVYAMKTGAWRLITSSMPSYSRVLSVSCYLNGVLHWVVEEPRYILTLDLSAHVFGMISLPNPGWETQDLTTIQGSLAVISRVPGDTWIWVRRDADASWKVVFKSKANQVKGGIITALELTNNGDLLLDTFWEGPQVYNFKTGARSTLVDFDDKSSLFSMHTYVETLQLLHMGTPCEETRSRDQEVITVGNKEWLLVSIKVSDVLV